MKRRAFTVFLSSPGDVAPERDRAKRVFEKLNAELRDEAKLELVRWEDTYYTAAADFQSQIPRPSECDAVLCILWKRLGTPLPPDRYRRPDGSSYGSGTEYEFEDAVAAARERQVPDIFVYRKTEKATFDAETAALEQAQWQALHAFWEKWFRSAEGHFTAAFDTFGSADEFELRLERHLRQWLAAKLARDVVWPPEKGSPFRGLRSFEEEHALVFFGRRRAVEQARALLVAAGARSSPYLLILGMSGSGKSSLVQAGLIPRMKEPGAVAGVDVWRFLTLRPSELGDDPLGWLARKLLDPHVLPELVEGDFRDPDVLARQLADPALAATPIRGALERAALKAKEAGAYERPLHARLLLYMDQLEELFALQPEARARFSALLDALVAAGLVWVVATLRSDAYPAYQADPVLVALKDRGAHFDLRPPGESEIGEIIRRPASAAGLDYERDGDRELDRLLEEAARAPGSLPLLGFTLDELYKERDPQRKLLTLSAYDRLGGLGGAIERRAEEVHANLTTDARAALPRVLRGLVRVDEDGNVRRGYADLEELRRDPARRRLVDAFIDARLFTAGEADQPVVSVAHEALLTEWARARQHIETDRSDLALRGWLQTEADRWQREHGKSRNRLLERGVRLEEAADLVARRRDELPESIVEFVGRSLAAARRQARFLAAVASVAILLIGTAAIVAGVQWRQAEGTLRESRESTSRFLADLARQRLDEARLGEALALARRAVPLEIEGWPRVRTAENALALAMQTYSSAAIRPVVGLVGHEGTVRGGSFSADGTGFATWSYDATARVWDVETGAQQHVLRHDDGVIGARFFSAGDRLLTWSFDGTARIWDAATGEEEAVLAHEDVLVGATLSEDESRVLTWSYDDSARIWDAQSGGKVAVLPHQGVVREARFFDDDRRVLTRSFDGLVGIWRASDGAPLHSLRHDRDVNGAILFADESRMLTWSFDESLRVWDLSTGRELVRLNHDAEVRGAELSPDERQVLSWSGKLVRLWDLRSGVQLRRFEHDESVVGATFSSDQSQVLSWSGSGVRLWTTANGESVREVRHSDLVIGARFSPDEERVLSWSHDGTARLWRGPDQGRERSLRHDGAVRNAWFSSNGQWIWTQSDDGTVRLWPVEGVREQAILRHQAEILGAAYSPNGTLMATASADGVARIWDYSPDDRFTLLNHDERVLGAAFSSEADELLTWSMDGTARVWDPSSGEQRLTMLHDGAVRGGSFSADHRTIVTWSDDRSIRLWDLNDGAELARSEGSASVQDAMHSPRVDRLFGVFDDSTVALFDARSGERLAEVTHAGERAGTVFSDDGTYGMIWSSDGTLRVLDAEHGAEVHSGRHEDINGAGFSPDGSLALSWSDDGSVRTRDIRTGELRAEMRHARSVVGAVFDPQGERVLTWGDEAAARIWDAESGEEILTLQHTRAVNGAAFDLRGDHVWTWSHDGSVRLWRSDTGDELRRFQHPEGVSDVTVLERRSKLVTRSGRGDVYLWDTAAGDLLAAVSGETGEMQLPPVSNDARRLATWFRAASVRVWPLWETTEDLVDSASRIVDRLRPLSPLALCHAYLETRGCDDIPGNSERELALMGDIRHLSLSPSPRAGDIDEGRVELQWPPHLVARVRIELRVSDEGNVFVFHALPLGGRLIRAEYDRLRLRLAFRMEDGTARDFGVSVPPHLGRYVERGTRVMMVQMDYETGQPVSGDYFPLLVH